VKNTNIIKADDYISYLQEYWKLHEIPLIRKDAQYMVYIESLYQYLSSFIRKSLPLMDYDKFEQDISTFFMKSG